MRVVCRSEQRRGNSLVRVERFPQVSKLLVVVQLVRESSLRSALVVGLSAVVVENIAATIFWFSGICEFRDICGRGRGIGDGWLKFRGHAYTSSKGFSAEGWGRRFAARGARMREARGDDS